MSIKLKIRKALAYFSPIDLIMWGSSVTLIFASFLLFGGADILTLAASLIGVTSLIFAAKGNPLGQLLMVVFSIIYGIISFGFAYYGEMLTYIGMTLPMSVFALISWLRNPYNGDRSQVKVNRLKTREYPILFLLTIAVTVAFYFILRHFGTANLLPSTFSVTTSFAAVYLTFRRSPYFALAYAANDIVLIILWVLASLKDVGYLSVTICFVAFLACDIYGFISWRRMEKLQRSEGK